MTTALTSAGLTDAAWYAARGAGVVCLLLLTVVVGLGIATRSGRPLPGLPRFAVAAVHRNAALLAIILLGLHVGLLVLDPYAQIRLVDVVLPFTAAYRPLWVGLGTLALDLLLAVVVTSLLRHRLGVVAWRLVHWAAYAIWPLALLHGLRSGTDAGQGWFLALSLLCAAVVAALLVWRGSVTFTEYGGFRVSPGRTAQPGYPVRHGHPVGDGHLARDGYPSRDGRPGRDGYLAAGAGHPARPARDPGRAQPTAPGRPPGWDRGGVPR